MAQPRTLLTGLGFGESPRWHAGRLWFCNWGFGEVMAVGPDGTGEVVAKVPTTIPFSIDWLPNGRLVIVSGQEALLLRQEPDGSLVTHADLTGLGSVFNEIVVDGRGSTYVNGENIVLVTPDGSARQVADGLAFGNGMVVTPDNATLIVAESHGSRLHRVRHRRRRQPVRPAGVGRPGRRGSRRHLHRCRRRRLVRGRAQQALRTGPRRR